MMTGAPRETGGALVASEAWVETHDSSLRMAKNTYADQMHVSYRAEIAGLSCRKLGGDSMQIKTVVATAAVVFAASAFSASAQYASKDCKGVNACKGQGSCKSATNACKGQNACKGKGWTSVSSTAECLNLQQTGR